MRFWPAAILVSSLLIIPGAAPRAEIDSRLNPGLKHHASQPTADDRYAAFIAANTKTGPVRVPLRDQAVLDLPDSYAFLPEQRARDFMKSIGNRTDANFLGVVLPAHRAKWFVSLEYIPTGFIRDDDAKNWNTDSMLAQIRTSTAAANEQRRAQNIPELEILGWVEKPRYDAKSHDLVWSISARNKGTSGSGDEIINYRALVLGRQGYVALVLVTDLAAIASEKFIANTLVSGIHFDQGKKYGDFNASTDRVAEYGLAALIGGLAIKKLGLFALAAAFLVKSLKVIAVLAAGAFAWFRRLFRRRKPAEAIADVIPSAAPVISAPPAEPK